MVIVYKGFLLLVLVPQATRHAYKVAMRSAVYLRNSSISGKPYQASQSSPTVYQMILLGIHEVVGGISKDNNNIVGGTRQVV